MGINEAESLHAAWADRFNAQDVDGMLALFEADAVFVPQPGTTTTGEGIRHAMSAFLQIGLPVEMRLRHVLVAGDVALGVADWSIKGTGADGNAVDLSGTTADVLRRGTDGWRFAIDNPFGTS